MPELLLELGCEEIPASFVRKAYEDLLQNVLHGLKEAGIGHGESACKGTPRRFIVSVQDVDSRQPDVTKEMRGPSVQAAYDAEGKPTKALEGFCRGQGVTPAETRDDGEYIWVTKTILGKDTSEVLVELLPKAIRSLSFDKGMRWAGYRLRFARPIRWILAAFDGKAVGFEIEGVRSGIESRGHRFNHPGNFEATSFSTLVETLRAREVEPDAAVREDRIRKAAVSVSTGKPDLTDALVDENVFLTEWPNAVEGTFKDEYLELPEPVLVTAMAKHERFFPVRDDAGNITNNFVSIRNGGVDDVVRAGNAWVLNARFNDAMFFYEEDKKYPFEKFLEDTKGILFQEKLGTVRQRADRLAALAAEVAEATGGDAAEVEFARTAGRFAKADLSTGLVGELTSLQGVIGGVYARREGLDEAVATALQSQYDLGKVASVEGVNSRTALRLIVADQLDKLAGYLGVGLAPSGSSDPFGLRRAATVLIEAAWMWPAIGNYLPLFAKAFEHYKRQGVELDFEGAVLSLIDVFRSRYESLLPDAPHDVLEAATTHRSVANPRSVRFSMSVMERLSQDSKFVQTATRPLNIVTSAKSKGISFNDVTPDHSFNPAALQSPEGERLLEVVQGSWPEARAAFAAEDADRLIAALQLLEEPITAYFDKTMVMVDDEELRAARLELASACGEELLLAGDFTKIVIEG